MSSNLEPQIQRLAEAIFQLGRINPFADARAQWEREALGGEEEETEDVQTALGEVADELAGYLRQILSRQAATPREREWYAGIVFYALRERYREAFIASHEARLAASNEPPPPVAFYEDFVKDFEGYFRVCGPPMPEIETAPHLFACADQIVRAEEALAGSTRGDSVPIRRLRAAMWQSVFTFDALRHRRFLYRSVESVPTLVAAAVGSEGRRIAEALAVSGYLPFDPEIRRFVPGPITRYVPLHARSAAELDEALYGLRKTDSGAFAAASGVGGVVVLDGITALSAAQQAELSRVIETRTFRPADGGPPAAFDGRIVVLSDADLAAEVASGAFDRELFLRMRGDNVVVPTLRQRLDDNKRELHLLVRHALIGTIPELYLDEVSQEVHDEIIKGRGNDWPWPGNLLELEQCVQTVLIEGRCAPPDANVRLPAPAGRFVALEQGTMSLAEVAYQYCRHVWELQGTYKSAAEVLGIDWRTVKNYVEAAGPG
ncbi:MAG: sigma 54-interacting transcriptional regulator [Myxococcota bacterium]